MCLFAACAEQAQCDSIGLDGRVAQDARRLFACRPLRAVRRSRSDRTFLERARRQRVGRRLQLPARRAHGADSAAAETLSIRNFRCNDHSRGRRPSSDRGGDANATAECASAIVIPLPCAPGSVKIALLSLVARRQSPHFPRHKHRRQPFKCRPQPANFCPRPATSRENTNKIIARHQH